MSTFPYNVDVIAKVINIRDFFVTLFFVARGMTIPQPSLSIVATAVGISLFVLLSRLLAIFPVLYFFGNGLRASLIPSINLSQMSEFFLIIASLGLTLKHISLQLVSALTFVFALTAVLSTISSLTITKSNAGSPGCWGRSVLPPAGILRSRRSSENRKTPLCFSVAFAKPARFSTSWTCSRKKQPPPCRDKV